MKRRWLIVLIVVVSAGAAVVGALSTQADRGASPPLEGELSHDFGDVYYDGTVAESRHVFELRNVRDEPIHIEKIATTCGCTESEASTREIAPGDYVELRVTLTFPEPGHRSEQVKLALRDLGVLTLGVSGTARRRHNVYASTRAVRLERGSSAEVILISTDKDTSVEPAAPDLDVPPGVGAEFRGWRLVFPHDEAAGRPSRWQAIVTMEQTAERLETPTILTIRLDAEREIDVELTGRPWG
jgi:hypothetical protein